MTVVPISSAQQVVERFDANDNEQLRLIRELLTTDLTDDEFSLYVRVASHTGLDPFKRQVYAIKRRDQHSKSGFKLSIQTGIDGYRAVAQRTGLYAGSDDAIFDGLSKDKQYPGKATVTVYKIVGGIRCPFTASARWDEYVPPENQRAMWKKMPHNMLAKCAESLALRKAFPEELAGIDAEEALVYDASERTIDPNPVEHSREELLGDRYAALSVNEKVAFTKWVADMRAELLADDPESPGFVKPYDETTLDMMEERLDGTGSTPESGAEPGLCEVCGEAATNAGLCAEHQLPPDAVDPETLPM